MVNMWPAGVNSKPDMAHFCQMMVGRQRMANSCLDYTKRMPSPRQDCFLLFIEGGCGEGTLLSCLRECVPALMGELKGMAQHSDVAVKTGTPDGASWYNSGQLSKSSCVCRLNFGGEYGTKTRKNQPVNCDGLRSGRTFESGLMHAMQRNYPVDSDQAPVYFAKAFHAVLNDTDHVQNHRIDFHNDHVTGSYSSHDPITSLSWGCTGVLVLKPASRKPGAEHLIVTRSGDVSIMGGEFQKHFLHAVPPVSQWQALLDEHRSELQHWEIAAMEVEIAQHKVDQHSVPRTRHNITIRWHDQHRSCLWAKFPLNLDAIPPATVAAAISQFNCPSSAKPADAFRLGTGYRPFCQSPSTVAQPSAETGSSAASASATACGVAVTVAATGSSEATACGDTRSSRKRANVEMVDVAVQTTEEMPRCHIAAVLIETSNLVSAAYRAVEFLPTVLRACSFTGSDEQWITEKPCLESLQEYVDAMQENLDRFEKFVLDMGIDEQSPIQLMVHQNTSVLHILQAALDARFALKRQVERLRRCGATFLELRVKTGQTVINNSHWLTKVKVSHAVLQELLAYMHAPSLQKHGDIVISLPADMPELNITRDGERHVARRGDMVYVGFFEIGSQPEATTRRMHLRTSLEQRGAWEGPEQVTRVVERVRTVLVQCLTHVRDLDVQRKGCARSADSVSASYDVSIWIGPHRKRLEHLNKKVSVDRSTPAASSTPARDAWQNFSSSRDEDWWQSQHWQWDDPGANNTSVRSRPHNWDNSRISDS
jgi:hypothetical protein